MGTGDVLIVRRLEVERGAATSVGGPGDFLSRMRNDQWFAVRSSSPELVTS